MCVCVCVCVCVHSCVLISHTILPDVTYFSPDVTYFLIMRTTYYQEGVFVVGNLMWHAYVPNKFYCVLDLIPHQEKSNKNMYERVCDYFCVINLPCINCEIATLSDAEVRAPGLESQGCEFYSHWVSTLATLGKLLT